MPSIVGNLKVLTVGPGSILQIGDAFILSPNSTSKTYAGSGSFNTGDLPVTNNGVNATLTNDSDVADNAPNKVASL